MIEMYTRLLRTYKIKCKPVEKLWVIQPALIGGQPVLESLCRMAMEAGAVAQTVDELLCVRVTDQRIEYNGWEISCLLGKVFIFLVFSSGVHDPTCMKFGSLFFCVLVKIYGPNAAPRTGKLTCLAPFPHCFYLCLGKDKETNSKPTSLAVLSEPAPPIHVDLSDLRTLLLKLHGNRSLTLTASRAAGAIDVFKRQIPRLAKNKLVKLKMESESGSEMEEKWCSLVRSVVGDRCERDQTWMTVLGEVAAASLVSI